jgi:peptidoglycan/xylan/chitin deacetylase (PgdA/CDA1 family)
MYYRIADPPPGQAGTPADVSCPRALFRAHLDLLAAQGYTSVTFREVRLFLETGAALPAKPVVLSFDDGDANHWDAFEDLRARHMTGVFFVITKLLGDAGRLSVDQLRTMASAGMEIGSHSISHWDLKDLKPAEKEREILGSKAALEGLLGGSVISFCYPGGNYDRASLDILAASGYWFARTTKPGVSEVAGRDFELKTIPIFRGTTPKRLAYKLATRGR